MILIDYILKHGGLCPTCHHVKGCENLRCREANHKAANNAARDKRMLEESVRRIVETWGPAAAQVYTGRKNGGRRG